MAFLVGLVDLPSVCDPAVAMDEATKTVENPRQASLDNSNRGHLQIGRKGDQCQQGTEGRHSFTQLIVHQVFKMLQIGQAEQVDTMDKLFRYCVKKYGGRKCMGTRDVLGEEQEKQPNGKVIWNMKRRNVEMIFC